VVGGKTRADAICTGPKSIRREESKKGEAQKRQFGQIPPNPLVVVF
jgi:hypothetical protein